MEVLTCPLCGNSGVEPEGGGQFFQTHWRFGEVDGIHLAIYELRVHALSTCATCGALWAYGDGTVIPAQAIDGISRRHRPGQPEQPKEGTSE